MRPLLPEEYERALLSPNRFGLVDVLDGHVERVAEVLSQRNPTMVFFWVRAEAEDTCRLFAVRADDLPTLGAQQEDLVLASEAVAINVARKFPVPGGFLARFTRKRVAPGGFI